MWESGRCVWAAEIWYRSADPACEHFLLNTQKVIHPPWKVLKAFSHQGCNVLETDLYRVFVCLCAWETVRRLNNTLYMLKSSCEMHIEGFAWKEKKPSMTVISSASTPVSVSRCNLTIGAIVAVWEQLSTQWPLQSFQLTQNINMTTRGCLVPVAWQ